MILLVINEKKTETDGRIICDVFSGDISVTKTGYISGDTKKMALNHDEIISTMKGIKFTFIDSGTIIIEHEDLTKIIANKKIVLGRSNNRRILAIQEVTPIKLNKVSLDKNKLYITTRTDIIKIDETYGVIPCAEKTLFIKKGFVWILNAAIDKKLLKQVIFSRRPKSPITKNELFVSKANASKYEICNNTKIVVNVTYRENQYYMFPEVYYNGLTGQKNDKQSILVDGKYYYRDVISERKINNILSNYEMVSPDVYAVSSGGIYHAIQTMINNGFEVYFNKKSVVVNDAAFSKIHIKNEIDWFAVEGNVVFDDESIGMSDLINANTQLLETNNSVLLMPDNVVKILNMVDSKGYIKKTPQAFIEMMDVADGHFDKKNMKNLFDNDLPLKISEELIKVLYDYQFDGVVWMKSLALKGYGGCLADDMGLGKTIQVLAFLMDEDIKDKFDTTILIVPKTLLGNWMAEFEKYQAGELKVSLYYGANRKVVSEAKVIITTYETFASDYEILCEHRFDLVILDEAQKVKNHSTKSRKLIKCFSVGKVLFAVTGTPYENDITELWSIMDLTNPGILGSLKSFYNKYSVENANGVITQLSEILSPFLLRRTKDEVLNQLPKKTKENIICIMDEEQQKIYNAMLLKIKRDLKKKTEPGAHKIHMLNGLTFLREICCHPQLINDKTLQKCNESIKLDVIEEIVHEAVRNNEKIVIFSQFTRFLGIIRDVLQEANIQSCYIDGKTVDRQNEIKRFEENDRYVFLISLKAGGFGINLTNAKKLIICDPWWNPAVERQAEDRIYRIGQTDDVIVYRLITKSTVEEKIQQLKEVKDEMGDLIFENMKELSDLEMDEIAKMLE